MSADISPAKEVFAHGFFTIDGVKMSKSLGNVISPVDLSEKFGNDALRMGLLSSFEFGNDGDFSLGNFAQFYETQLAGGVGNLFNRVIVLIHKFMDGRRPQASEKKDRHWNRFCEKMENKQIRQAIEIFFDLVDTANQTLNKTEVWKLAKIDLPAAEKVFGDLLGNLTVLTKMSEILLPESHQAMSDMIGNAESVGEAKILFVRQA